MAIIYTYPVKTTPAGNDLILISDSADSNKTKQIKISSLPSSGAGITLTTTGTSGVATLTGSVLNIPNYATGGTPSLPLNGVQYRNANGNFAAASSLIFESNNGKLIVGDQANDIYGIIEIQSDSDVGAELKIQGGGGYYTTIRGSQVDTASYNITLPVAGPGGNNKILQSDSSGNLSWINTPSGSGGAVDSVVTTSGTYINLSPSSATTGAVTVTADLNAVNGTSDTSTKFLSKDNTWDVPSYTTNTDTTYTLGAGTKSGVSIPLNLDAATGSDSTVNFTEGANITLTSSGATEITIASSGGGKVGFSPMSIYEGQDLVGSGGAGGVGNIVTFARQTVVENECTINTVDFFRLEGDQDISVHVYEGTIANAASANLVLSGTSSGGNVNEINKLTFNKTGYTSHAFAAGASVVILVSFDYVDETQYSNAVGNNDLYRVPNLAASGAFYYNVGNIPTTLNSALDQLEEGNQYGVSLHFYNKDA